MSSFVQGDEKYKSIIENMNLGLLEVDLNDVIQNANNSFCEMVGYSREELIGRSATELLSPDKEVAEKVQRHSVTRKDGHHSVYEIEIKHKKGHGVWVLVSGGPLYDEQGKVIGSIGIHHNFSEKRKIEKSLKEINLELAEKNEELLQKQDYLKAINEFSTKIADKESISELTSVITESIIMHFDFEDCVIYIKDPEGDYLYQSSAFGPKNMMGKIVNPLQIKIGEGIVGTVAKTGKAEIIHDTSKDSRYIVDDQYRYSEITVPIIYDNKVLGVIDAEHPEKNFFTQEHLETLTTITNLAASKINSTIAWEQQLRIESDLKESESKFRNIINSSLDAVIMIDSKGIITEWNDQSVNMFEFTQQEAVGQPLSKLIIPHQHIASHIKGMQHYKKTGEGPVLNKRIEITAVGKKREEFPIELSIVPISIRNQKFFSAFLRDISEEKANQLKIESALAREKELNEMKSKFVSMTSHEFRTPLTTIKSNVDLLAYKIENKTKEATMNKNVERIQVELDRLTNLMNDILTIGRIESGRMPFAPESCDLYALITNVINQSFSTRKDNRSVKIELEGKPVNLLIDDQIFTHVIINLVSNAFKYSEGKPNPVVNIKYTKAQVDFSIRDFGIGIPNTEIENLTESFYRASNVGNIQGTGLGMTLVNQFVKMHKGELHIESKEDKGTTVTVQLPYPDNAK